MNIPAEIQSNSVRPAIRGTAAERWHARQEARKAMFKGKMFPSGNARDDYERRMLACTRAQLAA